MSNSISINSWTDENFIWQNYLAKQLLVPMINGFGSKQYMMLASAHYIRQYKHEKYRDGYLVKILLDNGKFYYFPTICKTLAHAYECEHTISQICLGEIELGINDWLSIYPGFESGLRVMEWERNAR